MHTNFLPNIFLISPTQVLEMGDFVNILNSSPHEEASGMEPVGLHSIEEG